MPTWTVNVLWGVCGSVVASVVFLLALSLLRPRLKIAPVIAKTRRDEGEDCVYRLKVVNRSRRSCVDVSIDVFVVRDRSVPSSDPMKSGTVRSMRRAKTSWTNRYIAGYKRGDSAAKYAQRFRVDESIIKELVTADQDRYIVIRVIARDGVSGFSKVKEQEFKLAGNIQDGTFESGKSLKVVPWVPHGTA